MSCTSTLAISLIQFAQSARVASSTNLAAFEDDVGPLDVVFREMDDVIPEGIDAADQGLGAVEH